MIPIHTLTLFEIWKRENAVDILLTMKEFGISPNPPNTRPGQYFADFAGGIYFGTLPKKFRLAFYKRTHSK